MAIPVSDTLRKVALKRKLSQKEQLITTARKKIRYLHQKNRRLSKKNTSLKDIINHLEEKLLISSEVSSMLENSCPIVKELCAKTCKNPKNTSSAMKYSENLRAFAVTLHFYSPKAYDYVRKTFRNCLPHSKTLQKWYQSVLGEPGFSEEVCRVLKRYTEAEGKAIPCALMLDEMAIRQHVQWQNNRLYGHVDIGSGVVDDGMPLAKEALVFMVVALNKS